jgi:hypothetical protein
VRRIPRAISNRGVQARRAPRCVARRLRVGVRRVEPSGIHAVKRERRCRRVAASRLHRYQSASLGGSETPIGRRTSPRKSLSTAGGDKEGAGDAGCSEMRAMGQTAAARRRKRRRESRNGRARRPTRSFRRSLDVAVSVNARKRSYPDRRRTLLPVAASNTPNRGSKRSSRRHGVGAIPSSSSARGGATEPIASLGALSVDGAAALTSPAPEKHRADERCRRGDKAPVS